MMNKRYWIVTASLLFFGVVLFLALFPYDADFDVLFPKGMIGVKQRNLLVIATLLMMIVVIPVVVITFLFAWKYRAENKRAKYEPEWDNSHIAEAIWWGLPCVIIFFLAILCWKTTHELDPFKPIVTGKKPVTIQVVALQWKWLFLYPEEQIATVNFIQFPENTPLNFEITADAPMNSFWIPALGSQIYAMPGMKTKLHLIANETGSFKGSSANLSGKGFAGMTFVAKATTQSDYERWVKEVKKTGEKLDFETYYALAEPTEYHPVSTYVVKEADLFEMIVMQPMMVGK